MIYKINVKHENASVEYMASFLKPGHKRVKKLTLS